MLLALAPSRLVALAATAAVAGDNESGFKTSQPSMLTPSDGRRRPSTPIITVGDDAAGGYRFEAIPDGISLRRTRATDASTSS